MRSPKLMTALLTAALLCTACGSSATSSVSVAVSEPPAQQDTANTYAAYDGYACTAEDGHTLYCISTTDGFQLHCFFRSGSPEYEEAIYDLTLPDDAAGAELTVQRVSNENGTDVTDTFPLLRFLFYPDRVVMKVERQEEQLAGGAADQLTAGTYTLLSPEEIAESEPDNAQTAYSTGALVAMARAYYVGLYGVAAPEAECIPNDDGTYTIHLYERNQIDDDVWNTATLAWYTVDAYGEGQEDATQTSVQLPALSVSDTAAYLGAPVILHYVRDGEARNEWDITDADAISACLTAIQQLLIGDTVEERAADAAETLTFTLADGSEWTLTLEGGDPVENGVRYATEGSAELENILNDYIEGERA